MSRSNHVSRIVTFTHRFPLRRGSNYPLGLFMRMQRSKDTPCQSFDVFWGYITTGTRFLRVHSAAPLFPWVSIMDYGLMDSHGGTTALSDDFLMALAKKGAAKGLYQGKHPKLSRKMQTMLSVVMTRTYEYRTRTRPAFGLRTYSREAVVVACLTYHPPLIQLHFIFPYHSPLNTYFPSATLLYPL